MLSKFRHVASSDGSPQRSRGVASGSDPRWLPRFPMGLTASARCCNWKRECLERLRTLVTPGPETIVTSGVVSMSLSIIHAEALLDATLLSKGVDTHWVTKNRTVWNEQERVSEERELVYEISWIPELGAWRSFLRSQRRLVTSS